MRLPRPLTNEHLRMFCQEASAARDLLGPLSPWLLRPELRDGLRPKLSQARGAVHLLCARPDGATGGAALAQGFVLPCRWVEGSPDSLRLPPALATVAARVRDLTGAEGFGLHLGEGLAGVDLSGMDLPSGSCFAPLAAALFVACRGGRPHPHVFGTGCWVEQGGIGRVEGVEAKLAAVAALGIEGAIVYVPAADQEEAARLAVPGVKVRGYGFGERGVERALAAHLVALDVPPGVEEPLPERLGWANRAHVLPAYRERKVFYETNLLADLAGVLGRSPVLPPEGLGALAVTVGPNWGPSALVARAARPRRLLLLATADSATWVEAVRVQAAAVGSSVEEPCFLGEGGEREVAAKIGAWLSSAPRPAAVDITAGTKAMTAILLAAAARSGAQVLYLTHRTEHGGNTPLFGGERFQDMTWAARGEAR